MDILAEAQRRAFSLWLRTGRLPGWLKAARAEFKFNPWHDPDDGRFTRAGTGRYFGRGSSAATSPGTARHSDDRRRPRPSRGGRGAGKGRGPTGGGGWGEQEPFGGYGGGDGFNGGGASGSWAEPEPGPPPKRAQARPPRSEAQPPGEARPQPGSRPGGEEKDWQEVERNGYVYSIDTLGRTRKVLGEVTVNEGQSRSRTAQAQAGGPDRRPSDDGGHYIARRLNGPTDAFNHFAQDAKFNRGAYRSLEDMWVKATRSNKRVRVDIAPIYEASSQRPSLIVVTYWINGQRNRKVFSN